MDKPESPTTDQLVANAQIADLRQDYRLAALDESAALANPIEQFSAWFTHAQQAHLREPNAMTLATVDAYGRPSARIVLLKGVDANGFTWFTNYQSRKGADIDLNLNAALVFFWNELERQVRVEGTVSKIADPESDAYFQSRPLGSRLGAWVSPQSQVIASRLVLETREKEFEKQFELNATSSVSSSNNIPRPAHWGGYRLNPSMVEFWQGRSSRLHDRLRYKRGGKDLTWTIERLAP